MYADRETQPNPEPPNKETAQYGWGCFQKTPLHLYASGVLGPLLSPLKALGGITGYALGPEAVKFTTPVSYVVTDTRTLEPGCPA